MRITAENTFVTTRTFPNLKDNTKCQNYHLDLRKWKHAANSKFNYERTHENIKHHELILKNSHRQGIGIILDFVFFLVRGWVVGETDEERAHERNVLS